MKPQTIAISTLCALFVCTVGAASAEASSIGRGRRIGLGVATGNQVSGLSAKLYLRPNVAVQAIVGAWAFDAAGASVDALYTLPMQPRLGGVGRLQFNVGGGAFFYFDNGEAHIPAVNAALEVGIHFNAAPIEVVMGWRPAFRFGVTSGDTPVQAGFGVRWYL